MLRSVNLEFKYVIITSSSCKQLEIMIKKSSLFSQVLENYFALVIRTGFNLTTLYFKE